MRYKILISAVRRTPRDKEAAPAHKSGARISRAIGGGQFSRQAVWSRRKKPCRCKSPEVDIEINPPRLRLPLSATQQRGSNPLRILPTPAVNSIRGSAMFPLLPVFLPPSPLFPPPFFFLLQDVPSLFLAKRADGPKYR